MTISDMELKNCFEKAMRSQSEIDVAYQELHYHFIQDEMNFTPYSLFPLNRIAQNFASEMGSFK